MAKVSIILPSYNHDKFLTARLDSIVNQTFVDWELIIIDDCSTDSSRLILEQFVARNPLKVKCFITNENNSGSGYLSWKKGIELVETEYVWIAETDDYCDVNFLNETVHLLDSNPAAALVFVGSNYVDVHGNFLYDSSNRTKSLSVINGGWALFNSVILTSKLPLNPLITNGSSVLFRKPIVSIPENIFLNRQMSDLFLWCHLLKTKQFVFLNKNLNNFRRHESSTTTIANMKHKQELYFEYSNFVNYFNLSDTITYLIVKDYILNFLLTNHNQKGFFYFDPIKKIKSLNNLNLLFYLGRTFFDFFVLKISNKVQSIKRTK
ncbi:glycosyltransferase family 2 protein [Flavobacterium restrictum]|uniref:Glycosyltransferase family 2 protein n=1 Tax=Flavobacterium restrictum TaxID=2594428 RepID=A0A553E886_9FLAO|nr:glycosyltransferase family A protein [Flavobacterium restrictum]TRX41247.1 glycosyltransferase family 2 protein [Flavobacterium restrictum]